MKSLNQKLILLLVAQVVLVAGVLVADYVPNDREPQPLLVGGPADIETVTIEDTADESTVVLSKEGDQWSVSNGSQRYPASGDKVNSLLNALEAAQLDWPVADTQTAAERFEVSDASYRRKLVLDLGGEKQVFYLGTSPGYGQIHLRRDGDAAIYSVELNQFSTTSQVDDWLAKDHIALSAEGVTAFSSGDLSVENQGDEWQLTAPVEEGEALQLNQDAWGEYLDRWTKLRVSRVVKAADVETATSGEPLFRAVFDTGNGEVVYAFYKHDGDNVLVRNDKKGAYVVGSHIADQLADVRSLVAEMKQEKGEEKSAPEQPAPVSQNGDATTGG